MKSRQERERQRARRWRARLLKALAWGKVTRKWARRLLEKDPRGGRLFVARLDQTHRERVMGDVFYDAAVRVREGHYYDCETMQAKLAEEMRARLAEEGYGT